jgi:hypothetical protein
MVTFVLFLSPLRINSFQEKLPIHTGSYRYALEALFKVCSLGQEMLHTIYAQSRGEKMNVNIQLSIASRVLNFSCHYQSQNTSFAFIKTLPKRQFSIK